MTRLAAARRFASLATASHAAVTPTAPMAATAASAVMPSRVLSRLEEFYDAQLAEDLAILSYSHHHTSPTSPHLRAIQRANDQHNAHFMQRRDIKDDLRRHEEMAARGKAAIRAAEATAATAAAAGGKAVTRDEGYKRYLAPRAMSPMELAQLPPVYERLPQLQQINVTMKMYHAVTHSRKVLQYGLLALQLVTGQQGQIFTAAESDSKLRIRQGMPVGVHVQLRDTATMYAFLEKVVEQVLPKIRDFPGFSRLSTGRSVDNSSNHSKTSCQNKSIVLRLDAESWTAFPELEQTYLKFPQNGNVGSLQDFELELVTTARTDEEARLLLSGFRLPFVHDEVLVPREPEPEPEFIHDV